MTTRTQANFIVWGSVIFVLFYSLSSPRTPWSMLVLLVLGILVGVIYRMTR